MRKKTIPFILILLLTFTLIPVSTAYADSPDTIIIASHEADQLQAEVDAYLSSYSVTYSAIVSLTVSGDTLTNTDRKFLYDSEMYKYLQTVDFSGTDMDYFTEATTLPEQADEVNQVPSYAFGNWTALTTVKLPNSVTSIQCYAFNNCPALQTVYLPASLDSIEYAVFPNSSQLDTVYTAATTPPATLFHPNAFMDVASEAVLYVPSGAESAWDNKDSGLNGDDNGSLYQLRIENMAPVVRFYASRTSDAAATIDLSSNEPGVIYYSYLKEGSTPPALDISGAGEAFDSSNGLTLSLTGLESGAYDFYYIAKDSLGNIGDLTAAAIDAYVTPAAVATVSPSGSGASLSGNIVIKFTMPMDTSDEGVVSLDGGTTYLTGGQWGSDGVTYTIPYQNLSYNTTYYVTIKKFYDAVWNKVPTDSSHSFITISKHSSGSSGSGTSSSSKDEETPASAVPENGQSFTDVDQSDWYYNNVQFVQSKGLMNGAGNGAFRPEGSMTRGMIVTVLQRLSGDTGTYNGTFNDVPSGAWYSGAASWASSNGIAGGVGGNSFAPNRNVTREQLAVMLYQYAKYKGYDVSVGQDTNILSYKDALSISDYAYEALQWACGAGILSGDDKGNLDPKGSATRAEVAAMLQRFIESTGK